ncbi:hypothetical protein Vafri_4733 [Volvox africanus]|uniref:Uncharacterized protein n=1 Tax=Volvox africanus TaxID=51714 RepID=A0A8J4AU88_9CHLO|nr:hypothetical protein Vafri_4733 [Volvox africanus]
MRRSAFPRYGEVDCCLTTGEVLQLLQQRPAPGCEAEGLGAPAAPSCAPDPLLPGVPADEHLYGVPHGSSSGGYADFVFRTAAREVFGIEVPPGPLPWRTRRNADLQELSLSDVITTSGGGGGGGGGGATLPPFGSGQVQQASSPSLVVARVYGFRNIQTLLQQVRRLRKQPHTLHTEGPLTPPIHIHTHKHTRRIFLRLAGLFVSFYIGQRDAGVLHSKALNHLRSIFDCMQTRFGHPDSLFL